MLLSVEPRPRVPDHARATSNRWELAQDDARVLVFVRKADVCRKTAFTLTSVHLDFASKIARRRPATRTAYAMAAAPYVELPPRTASADDSEEFPSPGADDVSRGGHHPARIGEALKNGRYRVLARLGSGQFSTVWLCYDSNRRTRRRPRHENGQEGSPSGDGSNPTVAKDANHPKRQGEGADAARHSDDGNGGDTAEKDGAMEHVARGTAVAVKIQKSAQRYTVAAKDEISLLRAVCDSDPDAAEPVVGMLDSFTHYGPNGGHVCMVFDVMGRSLLDLIQRCGHRGVPMPLVKTIAYNVLRGLHFLHNRARIVHTDLKPENILMAPAATDYEIMDRHAEQFARKLLLRRTLAYARAGNGSAPGAQVQANAEIARTHLTKTQRKRLKAKAKALKKASFADAIMDAETCSHTGNTTTGEEPMPADLAERSAASSKETAQAQPNGGPPDEDVRISQHVVVGTEGSISGSGLGNTETPNSSGQRPGKTETGKHWESGAAGEAELKNAKPSTEEGEDAVGRTQSPESSASSSRTPKVEAQSQSGPEKLTLADLLDADEMYRRGDVKIIDLGNACWVNSGSSGMIQTRQYRSPEVIMGARFDSSADIWSVACIIFELATGDFLFDPHGGRDNGSNYDRDEDHLAQMIELLGAMPRSVSSKGMYAKELFNSQGILRHIRDLSFWPLAQVLQEKYEFPEAEALEFCDFLTGMLAFEPSRRASAFQCLQHRFLLDVARRKIASEHGA